MLINRWINSISYVKFQRNYSLCFNAFLALIVLVLLLILLISENKHSTVLVPVGLMQQSVVGSSGVSDSYLIAWAEFVANLKLNVTPETIKNQHQVLLPHISGKSFGKFKSEFDTEESKVQEDEISTLFFPKKTIVTDRVKHMVATTGSLQVYIAETLHESLNVKYELQFDFVNNRLLLERFTEVERV